MKILHVALFAALSLPAAADTAQITVTVDFAMPGAPIDGRIYGQFA
jgi:hypothetical protein